MRVKALSKELWLKKNNNKCVKCEKVLNMENREEAHAHHKTSKTKVDNMANLWNTTKATKEAKKVICLCSSCHKELHKIYGKQVKIKDTMAYLKA